MHGYSRLLLMYSSDELSARGVYMVILGHFLSRVPMNYLLGVCLWLFSVISNLEFR